MAVHLEREIGKLKKMLLTLGARVEAGVRDAVYAVQHNDWDLARQVIEKDCEIDLLEVDVEEEGLKILALHQPVAADLRFIVAAIKINGDLERIGDLASNIAERAVALLRYGELPFRPDFGQMSDLVKTMLRQSLDAMVNFDADLAGQVCALDDTVDDINRHIFEEIQGEIRKSPDRVEPLIHLLSTSRNLERIGDCATNISEDVIYMIRGQIVRHRSESERLRNKL